MFSSEFRFPTTTLAAENDQHILALPSIALDELDQRGILYRLIEEGELGKLLTPGGRSYVEHLREKDPGWPESVQDLAPYGCCQIMFNFEPIFELRVKEMLAEYAVGEVHISPGKKLITIKIVGDSSEGEEIETADKEILSAKAYIQSSQFDQFFRELFQAGIAGYSRETKILRSQDPDR